MTNACPCGKRMFSTKALAKADLKRVRKGDKMPGHERARAVYRCRWGYWHLTSRKQQAR